MIERGPDVKYGYAHYSGKPAVPDTHEPYFVPQSIADGWEVFCSCGQWSAFENFYNIRTRDALLAALGEAHRAHVASLESQQ